MGLMPSIYDYLDYRIFMRDTILHLRNQKKYNVREFSARAGFGSSNYVKMVIDRKRGLTVKTAKLFSNAIGLNAIDSKFFLCLVEFAKAKDLDSKNDAFARLFTFKAFQKTKIASAAQFGIFRHWYTVAILEALETSWGRKSSAEMAESLGIDVETLKSSLKSLQSAGFIEKIDGVWKSTARLVDTPDQMKSLNIRNLHKEMLQKALQSIHEGDQESRDLGALTIALSKKNYESIRAKLLDLRKEINSYYSGDPAPDAVYQLNIQLFPLVLINAASPNRSKNDSDNQ